MQQLQKAPEDYSHKFELSEDTDLLNIPYPQIGYKIHVPRILYEKTGGSHVRYVKTFCGQEDKMLTDDVEELLDENLIFCKSCTRYASKHLGFDLTDKIYELIAEGGEEN